MLDGFLRVFEDFLFSNFSGLVSISSELGIPFKRVCSRDRRSHIILYLDVDEFERKICEIFLTQSRKTGLITIRDQPVELLYIVGFKLNNIQEIVSYYLWGLALSLVVECYFEI